MTTLTSIRRAILGACLVAAAATPAFAQAHIQLGGGFTRAADDQPFFGAGVGARFGFFEIDAEGGRMTDILPKGLVDQLNSLQQSRGLPLTARAKLPATYALGSIRFITTGSRVRPFVSGGIGVARVEPQFDVAVPGIALADVFGAGHTTSENKAMVSVGAGLRFDVGEKAMIDAGYRYLRVFSDYDTVNDIDDDRRVLVNVNSLLVTFGVKF